MASRRSRIKGIAAIPQRRKPTEEENTKLQQAENHKIPSPGKINERTGDLVRNDFNDPSACSPLDHKEGEPRTVKIESNIETLKNQPENSLNIEKREDGCTTTSNNLTQANTIRRKCIKPLVNIVSKRSKTLSENSQEILAKETSSVIESNCNKVNSDEAPNDDNRTIVANVQKEEQEVNLGTSKSEPEIILKEINLAFGAPSKDILEPEATPKLPIKQIPSTIRRKFIKPLVNIVPKCSKQSAQNSQEILSIIPEKAYRNIESDAPKNDCENNISNIVENREEEVNMGMHNNETEVTLNEICLASGTASDDILEPVKTLESTPKLSTYSNVPSQQMESEYPPPPPSPSITGRVRIKAIPKFRNRKASFSASESEDETRKVNRMRNDSVCSSTSVNTEVPLDGSNAQKGKEINTIIQKKCNRTEQTRKLAEARREFQRRFGSSAPDRQKLTMMDLIFYSPDTNPMTKQVSKVAEEKIRNEKSDDESVDDPSSDNTGKVDKSDEENDVLVPQIKIGPSGEIILDEKSLVVERKDIKRQREQIAKSQIVDGSFDTYGVYKKHKRSKFWTTDETLRFYKALNTIGTDFTLMCDLFPDRTRRELKMKFNKEEKINRTLIDKALMQPRAYDLYVLKQEVELEQREKAELKKLKLEESKKKEERKEKVQRKHKMLKDLQQKAKEELEVKQDDNDKKEENREKELQKKRKKNDESDENTSTEKGSNESKASKKSGVKRTKKARLDINALLEQTEDADESDIDTNSEDEVISSHKPTRSGRMPKVPRKFDVNDEMVVEKIVKKSKDEIEPGSIMIVTEEGPTGEPVYKIFMITQDQERTEIGLNTDEANAIQLKKGITAKNILTISAVHTDDEEVEETNHESLENNITIPADETVTTLKSNSCPSPTNIEDEEDQHLSEKRDDEEVKIKVDQSIQFPEDIVHEKCDYDDLASLEDNVIGMRTASEEQNITIAEDSTITSLRSKAPNKIPFSNSSMECLSPIKLKMESDNTNNKSTDYVIFNSFSGNDENIEVD